jgi:beta-lactam-binding protein with PASTA domain
MLAALLVIGGCSALINDDNDSSSNSSTNSSSSSSVFDAKAQSVEVEDFVGMGLQAAQDAAQNDGIYNLDSTDATGQGRMQLWDRNWTVCAQTPAAGETMSADDTLTFDTVKSSEGETCDDPTGSDSSGDYGEDDSSAVSGTGDDYSDDSSSTVAGTGDDYSDDSSSSSSSSSTGGSDSSGDDSSSSSSSGGSQQAPAGATAQCNDGTYSYSAHRRGTCSHHDGVAVWLASVPS